VGRLFLKEIEIVLPSCPAVYICRIILRAGEVKIGIMVDKHGSKKVK
jgi:hypothetical protein